MSVASSTSPNHTQGMLDDAFTTVGHTGFRMDAQIMAAILYHYLTDATFRQTLRPSTPRYAGCTTSTRTNLRKAYAPEMPKPQP